MLKNKINLTLSYLITSFYIGIIFLLFCIVCVFLNIMDIDISSGEEDLNQNIISQE